MCFNKFTGEHNDNKILLKIFVSWEYIFKEQLIIVIYLIIIMIFNTFLEV